MLFENSAEGNTTHKKPTHLFFIALLATVALLLTACSPSAKEKTEPAAETDSPIAESPLASVKPETSAPSTPSTPPIKQRSDISSPKKSSEMKTEDESGAISTARYFIDLYIYATLTGDTDEFAQAYEAGCSFCEEAVENIANRKTNDHEILNGEVERTEGFLDRNGISEGRTGVHFKLIQDAAVILDANGETVSDHQAGTFLVRVDLQFRNGSWLVSEVVGGPE